MKTLSKEIRSQRERLQSFRSVEAVSQKAARRAKTVRQKEFAKSFREQEALRAQFDSVMKRMHGPVRELLAKDPRVATARREVRKLSSTWRKRKLAAPKVPKETSRIFAGFGATVVPPYDFADAHASSTGMPSVAPSANKFTGKIVSSMDDAVVNFSSASDIAQVGFNFRLPTNCPGMLRIGSNPAFTFNWDTICAFDSAHSDGWIGLFVEEFDQNGFLSNVLVDQRITLWTDDSWWFGAGVNTGSNSGFPLFALASVNPQHTYHIWVRCGGSISAHGLDTFGDSFAGSHINATVPSITWEIV